MTCRFGTECFPDVAEVLQWHSGRLMKKINKKATALQHGYV